MRWKWFAAGCGSQLQDTYVALGAVYDVICIADVAEVVAVEAVLKQQDSNANYKHREGELQQEDDERAVVPAPNGTHASTHTQVQTSQNAPLAGSFRDA